MVLEVAGGKIQSYSDKWNRKIKIMGKTCTPQTTVAIVGGLQNWVGGLVDAQAWIKTKVDAILVEDVEWYVKGDFNGVLFAKFGDVSKRDQFIDKNSTSNLVYDGIKVWSNIGKPVEDRVPERFFNGVRKQLAEWGEIDKRSIRVEMDGPSKK